MTPDRPRVLSREEIQAEMARRGRNAYQRQWRRRKARISPDRVLPEGYVRELGGLKRRVISQEPVTDVDHLDLHNHQFMRMALEHRIDVESGGFLPRTIWVGADNPPRSAFGPYRPPRRKKVNLVESSK